MQPRQELRCASLGQRFVLGLVFKLSGPPKYANNGPYPEVMGMWSMILGTAEVQVRQLGSDPALSAHVLASRAAF